MGEGGGSLKTLPGKPTRSKLLGRQRHRSKTILEWILMKCKMRSWINSVQNKDYWRALVQAAFNL